MPSYSKNKMRRLSCEFSKHIARDLAKEALRGPKIILEGQCLWPGRENFFIKILNWIMFFNLFIMELGQLSYLAYNISDMSKVARSCTTISTVSQMICKVLTLRYHKETLNDVLSIIFDGFWPADITCDSTKKEIKRDIFIVKVSCYVYLVTAFLCCSQFMFDSIIKDVLPLPSQFPFSLNRMPVYELIYIWQIFSNFSGIFILSGYDFLFCCLVMNCVVQFKIIQDVLKNIYATKDEKLRRQIFSTLGIAANKSIEGTNERLVFIKCTNHHVEVIKVCNKMEEVFSLIIFLQFALSTIALCVSSFVLIVNQTELLTMISYASGHMLQLFIYCAMGNELIYQSQQVAVAAFHCGWHTFPDKNDAHGVIMIIQRAQRKIQLTALGFVELSYRSFIMVVRLSFSFYTMLNNLNNK